jgi:hypothetical protein
MVTVTFNTIHHAGEMAQVFDLNQPELVDVNK